MICKLLGIVHGIGNEIFALKHRPENGRNMGAKPNALRILVVDDAVMVLQIISEMLTAVGYQVTATHNPRKALELIWNEHFDVVLTDLGMPELKGWTVARQVKAKSTLTPVILITGWGTQYEEADLSKYGVDLVLNKPLDWNSLTGAIDELITRFVSRPSEPRKHMRFRGRLDEFAALVTLHPGSPSQHVKILDISRGGLSFRHSENAHPKCALLNVAVMSRQGLELDLVQCRVVYDNEIREEWGFGPIKAARRCGVQFEELAQDRLSQLASFIMRCGLSDG
jgi:DNA-binding response OmpR family regulator